MIHDLDFFDDRAAVGNIIGASGASATTGVVIGVGPGYALAGAGANATGRTHTSTDTGAITTVNHAAGRAIAWGTAVGQDGFNTAYSNDRASGYANGGMRIAYNAGSQG